MQKKIIAVFKHCQDWDLKINIKKSKIIIGKNGSKSGNGEKWYLQTEQIETVKTFKYLGVLLNFKGTWETQNKYIWKTGVAALNSIRIIKAKLHNNDPKFLFRVYKALVEFKMAFGMEIWAEEGTDIMFDRMRARFSKIIRNLPLTQGKTASVGVTFVKEELPFI